MLQAAELGRMGEARRALEEGLLRSPRHVLLAEKLMEVLLWNDLEAVPYLANYLLKINPGHPRASQLAICLRGQSESPTPLSPCLSILTELSKLGASFRVYTSRNLTKGGSQFADLGIRLASGGTTWFAHG